MTSIRCVFAAEIPIVRNQNCPLHSHTCTELVYYKQGQGRLLQCDQQWPYQTGDLSINQPGQDHADHPDADGIQFCIGVSGCDADQLPSGLFPQLPEPIAQSILQLQEEMSRNGPRKQAHLDILAGWISLQLLRELKTFEPEPPQKPQAQAARELIDTRYSESISMDDLASRLHISSDHLRHIFKRDIGESPINYLIRKRLDVACELLTFSNCSVQEIAQQVGLENPYYFSRLFKKRQGITPTAYRRQTRSRPGNQAPRT